MEITKSLRHTNAVIYAGVDGSTRFRDDHERLKHTDWRHWEAREVVHAYICTQRVPLVYKHGSGFFPKTFESSEFKQRLSATGGGLFHVPRIQPNKSCSSAVLLLAQIIPGSSNEKVSACQSPG